MGKKAPQSKRLADYAFDIIGAMVPSCGPALRMVELGQKRPLKLSERCVLLYNSPLCPHCRCNREKFDIERAKMREIRAGRS